MIERQTGGPNPDLGSQAHDLAEPLIATPSGGGRVSSNGLCG
jgi:hypothetical protein